VREWFVPPLPSELEPAFHDDFAQASCRRLLLLAPLVLAGHAAHVAFFYTTGPARAALDPTIVRWHDSVAWVHAVTFVVTLGLGLAILRWGRTRAARYLAPAVALTYFLHGAAIAGADQLSLMGANGVAPFIGYCLFMALMVTMTPRTAMALYAAGGVAFFVSLRLMQPSGDVRMALLPNGISITLVSVVLSMALYGTRRRDFGQRRTIERQQRVLEELNTDLERRVASQVSETLKRAADVERLNAELRGVVRARSSELATALALLAQQREGDGALRPGAVLVDRFEVGELIGRGGMGFVHAGIDRATGERVAIKVVHTRLSAKLDSSRRFLREARAQATVSHPAVVRALHVDVTDDGMLFQVHELVDGVTLNDHMDSKKPWEPAHAARACEVLCDALAAAHTQGIVHRDVKPSNVMLSAHEPGLKLLDFGIAKLYEEARGDDVDAETASGVMLGTPAYMSPEQVGGVREVAAASDVYAIGIILFQLVAGRLPFEESTLHGITFSHLWVEPPDVRSIAAFAPARIADLVARCLRKDPVARPTARELCDALRDLADDLGAPPMASIARARIAAISGGDTGDDLPLPKTVVSGRRPAPP
jgi:serine/threonine-protein kinase